ncbi:hypothetical protein NOF55_00150 [Rhizobiaceae bacterium BDR2-2]|uniref:Uncharacterized protein n=1 Tax=Ectorhizobium quercum TaxID=2965071 RepID=A0AAE3SUQ1_9HYPH|nr:hypothetical protein [Ectorhizobium quercum]MCX8995515.1 hypothetical protein [Ectorhizobium quercum]
MQEHELEDAFEGDESVCHADTVGGLRSSLAGLADELDDYIAQVRSFLPVVAKHYLSPDDSLPDLYAAAVSLLYTTEEHMGRIASELAVIKQHPIFFRRERDGKE